MANPQRENGHIQISTEFWDALCKLRIPGQARQVLDYTIRKTWGWNKKEDAISLTQFVEGTGLHKNKIIDARNCLLKMNMIIVTEKGNDVTVFGNAESVSYSIQKDYEKWIPLPKKVTYPKKVIIVPEKGNPSYPKKEPTIDTYTKDNTKDNTDSCFSPLMKDPEFLELWAAWLVVRRQKKIPNTKHALDISIKKLEGWGIDNAKQSLRDSVERGWRGVFPCKNVLPTGIDTLTKTQKRNFGRIRDSMLKDVNNGQDGIFSGD